MGAKRTLLNKLVTSTRKPSKAKGTHNRRVIEATVDAGTHRVIYTYHTTKGRARFRVVTLPQITEANQ